MKKCIQNKWFLLIILSLTWGSSFILIKKSLLNFSPYEIGSLRLLVAGVLLSFIGIPTLRKLDKKSIYYIVLAGLYSSVLPLFLFPIAQTRISSSLAGVLDSLVPIFVLLIGFTFYGLKPKISQVFGVILSFFGVSTLIFFSESNAEETHLLYAMLPVIASVTYAISALLIRDKLMHINSVELTAVMFTLWTPPAFISLLFMGTFTSHEPTPQLWSSLGYIGILAVMGTTLAVIIYNKLIQETTAVFASSVSYLLPVLAVIWGIMDGEKFTPWYIFSGILILIGIYLIQEKKVEPQLPKKNAMEKH
ncbi:MAG TPA: DMT family transporter [Brumimicrobium sp.]|nr:DMT family transporter [Brumimicrobium sp.]